jgi:hypothetical protein
MIRPKFLPRGFLSAPTGVDLKRYHLCVLGPLALGLSTGLQFMMTALLLLGPSNYAGFVPQLIHYDKRTFRPEHDLQLFVGGILLALVAAGVMVWRWRLKLAVIEAPKAAASMASSALLAGVLAATSMIVYVLLLCAGWFSRDFGTANSAIRPPLSVLEAIAMLVPCAVALICAAVELEYGFCHSVESSKRSERWRLSVNKVLRYAVPVFIVLALGVPPGKWCYLAGQFFRSDGCLHLNFFMMGPALSFVHGNAFGTEIYSLYGIGWPLLASLLSHFSALTYANLIGMEIVYGCVYYVAVFFLLRSCFKQELWAAFAAVLAIYWQVFSGMNSGDVIWQFASSTIMRQPLDVWFFLALVMLQRSGRKRWAIAAGCACALGKFFETETGVYLVVTFAIYLVLQAGLAPSASAPAGKRGGFIALLLFCASAAVTSLPLFLYASRGTLFTRSFWHGWVEPLILYPAWGIFALPIAELPDAPVVLFLVMVLLYVAVFAYASLKAMHRAASQGDVLLAPLAAYGLALLLLFVSRSHPFNLSHVMGPFAIMVAAVSFRACQLFSPPLEDTSFPYALTGGLFLLLFSKADFQRYPSFLGSGLANTPTGGVSLQSNPPDIAGLPPAYGVFARDFQKLCSAVKTLAPDGKGVAILDPQDTLIYSAANARPWSRYTSLFQMTMTRQSLDDIRANLVTGLPHYVVVQGKSADRSPDWEFIWAPLYAAVTNRYRLDQTVGPYEIWRSDQ